MDSHAPNTKTTGAFYLQACLAFGVSLMSVIIGIVYLPGDAWPKAFLAISTLFLTTSSFTLAKCVRDAQENTYMYNRLEQARVDKILAEHNPWQQQSA